VKLYLNHVRHGGLYPAVYRYLSSMRPPRVGQSFRWPNYREVGLGHPDLAQGILYPSRGTFWACFLKTCGFFLTGSTVSSSSVDGRKHYASSATSSPAKSKPSRQAHPAEKRRYTLTTTQQVMDG